MGVHSSEEILRSIMMEIRRLVVRSVYSDLPEEQSREMVYLARSAYEYLVVMLDCCMIWPGMIGTNKNELRYLDAATKFERIKSAEELWEEMRSEEFFVI